MNTADVTFDIHLNDITRDELTEFFSCDAPISEGLKDFIIFGTQNCGESFKTQNYTWEELLDMYYEFQHLDLSSIDIWTLVKYGTIKDIVSNVWWDKDKISDKLKLFIEALFERYCLFAFRSYTSESVYSILRDKVEHVEQAA